MTADAKRSFQRFWLPVALALTIHAAFGIDAAARLTTTHDEYWHLPVGLLNLRAGRFQFDNLNPPLCRMAAALPLLATSAQTGPATAEHDAMGWGDAFVAANGPHYAAWFFLGRSVIVLISVLGGLVTAIWARELFGDLAGCFAALLWAFEPNLIAHGSLVTTDMGAAAFFVFTLYALWKFALRPGWQRAAIFGAVLGLAQLAKFTCLLLYPLSMGGFALIVIAGRRRLFPVPAVADKKARRVPTEPPPSEQPTVSAVRIAGMWIVALLLSVVIWNAGYLFRGTCSALRSYDFQSATFRGLRQQFQAVGWLPVPLPRDFVEGLDHQRQVMEQKHPVFLDGEWSEDGFPHYYLWALVYKLPHPLQLLTIATLFCLAVPGSIPRRPVLQCLILLPAAVMLVAAETSRMQLGIRYVLPALPFLILFAAQSAQWFDFKMYPLRSLTTAVLAAWMLLSVRYFPEHLAYFNELAGGPVGGREHLLDSNLDWGQDSRGLDRYLSDHKLREIGLAYFGTVPPTSLGIGYHVPPSRAPQAGRFAVSVNFEQGRPHWLRTPRGEIRPVDIGEFGYFAYFKPVARIGESIDVFELSEDDVAAWRSAARAAGRSR